MTKKLTISDIARLANVHKSTVSRYLNNPDQVNKENKKKIQKIVEEYKFRPNVLARTLSKGNLKSIAIIVPDRSISTKIISPYFPQTIYGVGSVAAKNDYNMTLITSAKKDADYLHIINNHQAEGFIILGATMDETFPYLLIKENIPFVIVGDVSNIPNCVSYDNEFGGYLAMKHLLELGHRNITIIGGVEKWFHNINRINGAVQAVNEANDHHISYTTIMNVNTLEKGYQTLKSITDRKELPDAIFCLSDTAAMGVNSAAYDINISIPSDLSLIGYGDIMYTDFIRPKLTTVREETATLGGIAMEALIDLIENPNKEMESIKLTPQLMIRDSTKASTTNSKLNY